MAFQQFGCESKNYVNLLEKTFGCFQGPPLFYYTSGRGRMKKIGNAIEVLKNVVRFLNQVFTPPPQVVCPNPSMPSQSLPLDK